MRVAAQRQPAAVPSEVDDAIAPAEATRSLAPPAAAAPPASPASSSLAASELPPPAASAQLRLTAWLRARAARDRLVVLEEALLGGAFWRFALRRLAVFGFARGWATALHLLELTFLIEIFAARPFVASLALQNATLIVDAFWWGALEALRRRLRAIGPRTDAQVLTTRFLTVAMIAGLLGFCVPLARLAWHWRAGNPPGMLDAYALVCLLRLALDLVLRALYSGVYAYGRVHRPAWSAPLAPTLLVGMTVALWPWWGGWSFVAALLVSVLASRALLLRFTLRGYRNARVPLPAWRVRRWGRRRFDWRLVGDSALAGTANLTTRLASVVLLATVIPSLSQGSADDDLQLLAYVLHLAAPLILVTCQWGFIFYHDWKRLEAEVAAVLARRLHAGLLAVAAAVAVVAWGATVLLVLVFTGWRWAPVSSVLGALGPTYLGLSLWTALQLRGFSRGEFSAQAVSAGVVIGAGALVGGASFAPTVWYWALAGCPWLAIGAHALLAGWWRAPRSRAAASLDGWVSLLEDARGPLRVWRARLAGGRTRAVVEEIRAALPAHGSVVCWRGWLLVFESEPGAGHAAWLIRCAGLLTRLESLSTLDGVSAARELVRVGWLAAPADVGAGVDVGEALAQEHARLFPGGFTLRVGQRPPPVFAALSGEIRQAIWRAAIRRATGARHHPSPASAQWRVTALAPEGRLTQVFVAPRAGAPADGGGAAASPEHAWAERLRRATWQIAAQ